MNYSGLSDFEINKLVAEALGESVTDNQSASLKVKSSSVLISSICGGSCERNYCNNPSDAWPVIIENKISLTYEMNEWAASTGFNVDSNGITHYRLWEMNKNPLRAAMIAFLMIKDVEKNKHV